MEEAVSICVRVAIDFRRSYKPGTRSVMQVIIRLFGDINVYRNAKNI